MSYVDELRLALTEAIQYLDQVSQIANIHAPSHKVAEWMRLIAPQGDTNEIQDPRAHPGHPPSA